MKNKNIKNKGIGIVEIIVAFLFFIESIWLYTKVSGTNLLFTDSTTGKIAAYYWVFLLIGLIVGILGIITIRKKVSIEDSKQLENNKEESSESEKVKKIEHIRIEQKADNTKEVMVCPACNTTIVKGKKFCTNCGQKLKEEF